MHPSQKIFYFIYGKNFTHASTKVYFGDVIEASRQVRRGRFCEVAFSLMTFQSQHVIYADLWAVLTWVLRRKAAKGQAITKRPTPRDRIILSSM